MKINKGAASIGVILLLTGFLTCFFYLHERLPRPLRALTAILETPVAIASGLSHYLNLGIPVYESVWSVLVINLLFSLQLVALINKLFRKRK